MQGICNNPSLSLLLDASEIKSNKIVKLKKNLVSDGRRRHRKIGAIDPSGSPPVDRVLAEDSIYQQDGLGERYLCAFKNAPVCRLMWDSYIVLRIFFLNRNQNGSTCESNSALHRGCLIWTVVQNHFNLQDHCYVLPGVHTLSPQWITISM